MSTSGGASPAGTDALAELVPAGHPHGDIADLAVHFAADICKSAGKPVSIFTDDAYKELKKMPWTGNVRELRNVIERLIILCDHEIDGVDVKKYAQPLGR